MIQHDMPHLAAALYAESWAWLCDAAPDLAEALQAEVARGANPEQIRQFVMRITQRQALAMRLQQAALHLRSEG